MDGGYPQTLIEDLLSEIKFTKTSLNSENKTYKEEKEILPFVTQYQPSVPAIKETWIIKMASYTKPTITSINF